MPGRSQEPDGHQPNRLSSPEARSADEGCLSWPAPVPPPVTSISVRRELPRLCHAPPVPWRQAVKRLSNEPDNAHFGRERQEMLGIFGASRIYTIASSSWPALQIWAPVSPDQRDRIAARTTGIQGRARNFVGAGPSLHRAIVRSPAQEDIGAMIDPCAAEEGHVRMLMLSYGSRQASSGESEPGDLATACEARRFFKETSKQECW